MIEAVAIDGPVASGKTTVGARVAKRLGYAFLDTGLIYRAATWQAIRLGVDVGDEHALTRMAEAMRITLSRSDEGRQAGSGRRGRDRLSQERGSRSERVGGVGGQGRQERVDASAASDS